MKLIRFKDYDTLLRTRNTNHFKYFINLGLQIIFSTSIRLHNSLLTGTICQNTIHKMKMCVSYLFACMTHDEYNSNFLTSGIILSFVYTNKVKLETISENVFLFYISFDLEFNTEC